MINQLPSEDQLKQKLFKKQTILQSDKQKNPVIFKWKTASLIFGVASAILLILNLIVLYNLFSLQNVDTNLTFLSSIVSQTQVLQNKSQIMYLGQNFQQIFGQTKFQRARLLGRLDQISEQNLKQIFYQKNNRLLFIISKSYEAQQQERFAFYMHSAFPIPKQNEYDQNGTYYSFQIKQNKKSSILSLSNNKTLKLSNPSMKSPLQCKNYNIQKFGQMQNRQLWLLNGTIEFALGFNQGYVTGNTSRECFQPVLQQQQFEQQLYDIVGTFQAAPFKVNMIQVYHLQ